MRVCCLFMGCLAGACAFVAAAAANDVEEAPTVTTVGTAPARSSVDMNFVAIFETWRARVRADGFRAIEENLLTRSAAGDADAASDLAYLYFASDLVPEALATIRGIDEADRTASLDLLAAAGSVKMGRWRDALDRLSAPPLENDPSAAPWRGIALVGLGAFDDAAAEIVLQENNFIPFEDHGAQYFLARGAAALAIGHIETARESLEAMRGRIETQEQRDQRRLLEARVMLANGDIAPAVSLLRQMRRSGNAPTAYHAQIELLAQDHRRGIISGDDALQKLNALSLRWSGGAVERERLTLEAILLETNGDLLGAVSAHRKLLVRYPYSDGAGAAEQQIRMALTTILQDESLSPRVAAEVFYENIDLAPPGAEGDALIRDAAAVLAELDLLDEAAELLRHQVFTRLRGAERSTRAADLAALYLQANNADAALEAIERSRRTRLPAPVAARRAVLEAEAHFLLGDGVRALSLLEDRADAASSALRGRILQSRGEHEKAGGAFAAAATGEGVSADEKAEYAILAASAFAAAGATDELHAFADTVAGALDAGPARDLVTAIAAQDLSDGSAGFQERYAAYFGD